MRTPPLIALKSVGSGSIPEATKKGGAERTRQILELPVCTLAFITLNYKDPTIVDRIRVISVDKRQVFMAIMDINLQACLFRAKNSWLTLTYHHGHIHSPSLFIEMKEVLLEPQGTKIL